jgi:hypothetical protein
MKSFKNLVNFSHIPNFGILGCDTIQPMIDIFGNRDSSRRINKCAMELLEHVVNSRS